MEVLRVHDSCATVESLQETGALSQEGLGGLGLETRRTGGGVGVNAKQAIVDSVLFLMDGSIYTDYADTRSPMPCHTITHISVSGWNCKSEGMSKILNLGR